MPHARTGHKHCTYCRKPESECGPLSARNICVNCAAEAIVAAAVQQSTKSGPYWTRRCRRQAAKAQRELEAAEAPV